MDNYKSRGFTVWFIFNIWTVIMTDYSRVPYFAVNSKISLKWIIGCNSNEGWKHRICFNTFCGNRRCFVRSKQMGRSFWTKRTPLFLVRRKTGSKSRKEFPYMSTVSLLDALFAFWIWKNWSQIIFAFRF